ncbi:hypothetical protein SCUP515_10708 [Seiridium cupressi]
MSLCRLCLKIPFDSLPRPHPSTRFSRTFDQTELPALGCSRECAETHGSENLGHLWHPNLEALGESANTCALCATVQGGFQAWLRHFDRGSKSDFYVKHREIYDDAVPAGQKLYLAQRYGGSPGFVVLVRDPKYERIVVLTGVSFSVDAGELRESHGHSNPCSSLLTLRVAKVIATNHAASAADGCFNIRPDRPSCKVDLPGYAQNVHVQTVYLSDEVDWYGGSFPYEPLSTRCWALQERILARRLLHYNPRQLYYECDSGIFGEDGSWQDSRYGQSGTLRLPLSETALDQSGIHELWYHLVGQYGPRKLTRITDRLPAMSGLAKRFATRINAQYLAGIWSDELLEGIAWQSLGSRQPAARDQYIAPSWSWASYGGTAAMGIHSPYTSAAEALGWDIQLKHEAYPFGESIGGWLRIHAPIVSLFTAGDDAWNTDEWSRRIPVTTAYSKPDDSITIHPDNTEDYDITYWKHLKMKAILLFQYEPDEERGPDDCLGYGLVVIDADDTGSNRMRRVGWMHLDPDGAQKMRDDQANWSIIELV